MSQPRLTQAWQLFEVERYEQALQYATDARGQGADPVECAQLASLCLTHLKMYNEAMDMARDALRQDPGLPYSHHVMGYALYRYADSIESNSSLYNDGTIYAKACEQAVKAYREAIRLSPQEPLFHEMLGFVYYEKDDYEAAEASISNALAIDPNRSDSFRLLSDIFRITRRYEEAHQYAMRALAINAEQAGSHAALGWARLMHGDAKSSLEIFQEALRIQPSDKYARQGLIEALKVQNRIIRLPYRLLSDFINLSTSKRWKRSIGWLIPVVAVIVFLIHMLVTSGAGQFCPGLILGIFVGVGVFLFLHWLPLFSWFFLTLCNIVLIPHPLGRMALTPSERCTAVALVMFPLPVLFALAIAAYGSSVGDPPWVEPVMGQVLALMILAAPLSLWAATLTTRWAKTAGIIFVASVAVYVLASLDAPPFGILQISPVPQGLLLIGALACVIFPSRL